jgi:hypothetical protein
MSEEIPEDRRAPEGHVWQCMACGKVAEDSYGIIGNHSYGWDESCALNCAPVHADSVRLP